MSEREFQRSVIDFAARTRWRVAHFHDSRRQVKRANGESVWIGDEAAAGFPDLTMVRGDRLVFAELKTEKGRLSPTQADWLRSLEELPIVETYLWRPSMWDDIVEILK